MQDFQQQLQEIQADLHDTGVEHEGITAEEAYAERLAQLHIEEGFVQDGDKVVSVLLARCLLWVEIIQER